MSLNKKIDDISAKRQNVIFRQNETLGDDFADTSDDKSMGEFRG